MNGQPESRRAKLALEVSSFYGPLIHELRPRLGLRPCHTLWRNGWSSTAIFYRV